MNNITVAIAIATYNQAKYISQTIESVLCQKAEFNYCAFIGDDASTDKTQIICQLYLKKVPGKIRFFPRKENNIRENSNTIYAACLNSGAKYIALLDGDDYWTDPNKLQKQVDFLEANPHVSGCFHDAVVVDENGKLIRENYYQTPLKLYDQAYAIVHGGAYATCSLVFRSTVLKEPPQWFLKAPCDYTIDLLITEYGDIAHLNENMGAYRIHNKGIWQGVRSYAHGKEDIRRFFICLTNPKFKKKYGNYFRNRISQVSGALALHYHKEKRYLNKLKYTWYYMYYARPFNLTTFNYLFGTLLFPSLYKAIRSVISKPACW